MRLLSRTAVASVLALIPGVAAHVQTSAQMLAFEVASVKSAGPLDPQKIASGQMRMGMRVSASRVDIDSLSLSDLINSAFRVKSYQVTGPNWLGTAMNADRFDIHATLPQGATTEHVPEMLPAPLAERFKLTFHRENKEHAVFALVVGKSGPTLRESTPDAPAAEAPAPGAPGRSASTGREQVQVSGDPQRGITVRGGTTGATRMSIGPDGMMHLEAAKLTLVAHVANLALKAAWFQKWSVHRRLRPEAFAGDEILDSSILKDVHLRHGSYLLPMAYPEGSPLHPSYPAGHAAIAGACVTALKAFFNEALTMASPVVASSDGSTLDPYSGTLTVGNELIKLASNIAIGRDAAGVHWRSDGIEGLHLGEAVAIRLLQDLRRCYTEDFTGFTFTRFDGNTVTISDAGDDEEPR